MTIFICVAYDVVSAVDGVAAVSGDASYSFVGDSAAAVFHIIRVVIVPVVNFFSILFD